MFKVSRMREDHGHAVLIRCLDYFFISDGSTGLNHGSDACCCGYVDTVSKREEGVGR
jgi:hypothetical protein